MADNQPSAWFDSRDCEIIIRMVLEMKDSSKNQKRCTNQPHVWMKLESAKKLLVLVPPFWTPNTINLPSIFCNRFILRYRCSNNINRKKWVSITIKNLPLATHGFLSAAHIVLPLLKKVTLSTFFIAVQSIIDGSLISRLFGLLFTINFAVSASLRIYTIWRGHYWKYPFANLAVFKITEAKTATSSR